MTKATVNTENSAGTVKVKISEWRGDTA